MKFPLTYYFTAFLGLVLCTLGMYLIYSTGSFIISSEREAQLHVVAIDKKRKSGSGGPFVYRPTFETLDSNGMLIRYSGKSWHKPKPHEVGDTVDGRVNWATGEIRSIGILKHDGYAGAFFFVFGSVFFFGGLMKISQNRTDT